MRNNNQKIVRKLTANTLKANKGRNIFLLIAIFLTTFMIATVFSVGASLLITLENSRIQLMGSSAHIVVENVTDEQFAKLDNFAYIQDYGFSYTCGSVSAIDDMTNTLFSLAYYDERNWNNIASPAFENIKGHYPVAEDEIMLPTWILEKLGITKPEVGMEFTLDVFFVPRLPEMQPLTFKLSGWFTSYLHVRTLGADMLPVSEAFAIKHNRITDEYNNGLMVKFVDDKVDDYVLDFENNLPIEDYNNIRVSPLYRDEGNALYSTIVMIVIALFLMFTGYLLIYNILYISISNDIRFYGLLKTIGMTPRQIKSTVYGQILRLCGIGIPAGLILSALLSMSALPIVLELMEMSDGAGVTVSFNVIIYIGAALFALLTAVFSAVKPSKKAARISPVEAVKYTAVTLKKTTVRRSISGNSLKTAWRNVFRIRKQAFMVFLSLFLGLTTFLCITVIIDSMDIDNFIEGYMDCDIMLTNRDAFSASEEKPPKFTPEVMEQLENLSGFISIDVVKLASASIKITPEITDKVYDFLKNYRMDAFENEAELAEYIESEPYVFLYGVESMDVNKGAFIDILKDNPTVNSIELRLFPDKEIMILPLDGADPGAAKSVPSTLMPNVFIPMELLESIKGDSIDVYRANLNIEEKYQQEAVELIENMFAGDPYIEINSRWDMRQTMANAKLMLYVLGGGLSLILGLIGIINFINIMFTEIFNRRREIAMLESIGQTKKQVKRTLMSEGAVYAVISAVLVLALGSPISYGLYKMFSQQATYAVYSFPIVQLIVMFAIIFAVCLIAPLVAYKSVSKMSLVERMKVE
jgi:ABC-type transport system, involved in lipoprotein release, permease component